MPLIWPYENAATNLKRDTFCHFGSMAILKSSKIWGVANWLNLQAVPPYVGSLILHDIIELFIGKSVLNNTFPVYPG